MNRDENQLLLHNNSICVTDDGIEKREFGEKKESHKFFPRIDRPL